MLDKLKIMYGSSIVTREDVNEAYINLDRGAIIFSADRIEEIDGYCVKKCAGHCYLLEKFEWGIFYIIYNIKENKRILRSGNCVQLIRHGKFITIIDGLKILNDKLDEVYKLDDRYNFCSLGIKAEDNGTINIEIRDVGETVKIQVDRRKIG